MAVQSPITPRTVLIAGLGSIGRRHLGVVRASLPDAEIVILRRPGRPAPDDVGAGVRTVHDMDAALATRPEAAIVANPAPLHVVTALPLARAGVPLLVEKPLAAGPDGIDELLAATDDTGAVLQIGYCLRHDPSLAALKAELAAGTIGRLLGLRLTVGQYLPDWRPGTDYRAGVSARTDLGGGVLAELSHEIDAARWLTGEAISVFARIAQIGDLEIDVEDTADIVLGFVGGVAANLHLDMLSRPAVREIRAAGTEGTLVWDGIVHESRVWTAAGGAWRPLPAETLADRDALFARQFDHFLRAIRGEAAPFPDGRDGARTLALVEAARESARTGRTVNP